MTQNQILVLFDGEPYLFSDLGCVIEEIQNSIESQELIEVWLFRGNPVGNPIAELCEDIWYFRDGTKSNKFEYGKLIALLQKEWNKIK